MNIGYDCYPHLVSPRFIMVAHDAQVVGKTGRWVGDLPAGSWHVVLQRLTAGKIILPIVIRVEYYVFP